MGVLGVAGPVPEASMGHQHIHGGTIDVAGNCPCLNPKLFARRCFRIVGLFRLEKLSKVIEYNPSPALSRPPPNIVSRCHIRTAFK